MSVQAITWVMDHPDITDRSTWAVLMALANRSDPEGWSWPARDRIARESRSSVSTVKRALRDAIDNGWLEVRPRTGTSNHYHLLLRGVGHGDPSPYRGRSSFGPGVGQALARGGGSSFDPLTVNGNRQEPRAGPVDKFDPAHPSDFVLSDEQKAHGAAELAAIKQRLAHRSATRAPHRVKIDPPKQEDTG